MKEKEKEIEEEDKKDELEEIEEEEKTVEIIKDEEKDEEGDQSDIIISIDDNHSKYLYNAILLLLLL